MNHHLLNQPGELYLGSSTETAINLGARRFPTVRKAVRFALEQAAPVSLRGALLIAAGHVLGPAQIRELHRQL